MTDDDAAAGDPADHGSVDALTRSLRDLDAANGDRRDGRLGAARDVIVLALNEMACARALRGRRAR